MSDLTTTITRRPNSPSPEDQNARSLYRQHVLEEDEYTAALSEIIARDFFPSLAHIDATNNYLDALRSADPHLINASVLQLQELATPATAHGRYRPLQTPSQTPYAGGPSDTPLRTPSGSERPLKRPRYDTSLSLDEFQAKYTSEDNSSFTQILEDENVKRREKYGWAWEAQRRVEIQKDKMLEMRERMLIEPVAATGVREKFMIELPRPAASITQGENLDLPHPTDDDKETQDGDEDNRTSSEVAIVRKNQQMPENDLPDVMAPRKDKRAASVDAWNFKTRNALMFAPDADSTPYASTSTSTGIATRGDPKVIKYGNTRLPEQEESTNGQRLSEPPSPSRSRIDAAIAGTPYRSRSPTINNYSLLPSIPSPTPEELGSTAVKQLMTWGTLNATPKIISRSEDPDSDIPTPNTPFRISKPSSRELIGMKLSNNASKSLRVKAALMKGGGGARSLASRTPGAGRALDSDRSSMPPPTWTPRKADVMGALTPAARRLLDKSTSGVASARRADAMGKTAAWRGSGSKEKDLNKVRWTPSPAPVAKKRP